MCEISKTLVASEIASRAASNQHPVGSAEALAAAAAEEEGLEEEEKLKLLEQAASTRLKVSVFSRFMI
jgi:hypothetical protein